MISHMRIDIRGALRNFSPRHWHGVVKTDEGKVLTTSEVREWLMDELAKGRKFLPFGKPCEGWSYDTGCPGHEEDPDSGVLT